ncbi:GRIP and coiled-coil domain-containing protein 1 [Cricetulus griseus]|uniref:GRIP and coiled-coil domain-containing protein 1 n=1 Tax=Cricetulus griseus TaxID=10029 RepID=G3GZ80_CRIGR|nr:GRIP and coiled-coil domain-containing protein 1 [Cricetulus griseus]XP_027247125.1 GRIP and coiled-coil domain-containing protein 1 [Cricetulus griseus]EGV98162.1 GRIP and coiled-coil domain-containing protein 1 [Cricetulus griseus]ERE91773.1 GRIP and coiled-coil domain-containing protein 1 [Cricetulus griseus]
MEKFGMNFGGGPSKKDLLETIETQKKQLLQYQARLKDVVRAYKSLLKEKEALEASIKVLSVSHEADVGLASVQPPGLTLPDSVDDRCSTHSEDSTGTATSLDTAASLTSIKGEFGVEDDRMARGPLPLKSEEASGSESGVSSSSGDGPSAGSEMDKRLHQLKTQLATLTSSLATVTQEKSRMEASYLADKKKMKQDLEDANKKAEEERDRLVGELKGLQEQIAETKARLITQQHDRAQEQSDHAVMLRELQKLLQEERTQRQDLELRLEETREALAGRAYAADQIEGFELQTKQLTREVEELKGELQAIQDEKNRPDPRLQELQQEAARLKSHFQAQLQQEMRKTALAEDQLRQQCQVEEQRVAALENQISEVSELLGTYEKAKQKDQLTIQKLKERILQLDLENKTLALAASSRSPLDSHGDESSLDINVLKDKMEKLKRLLQVAARKSQVTLDVEKLCDPEIMPSSEAADGEKATALYYQQELKQLKEEFERYKMRAQVVLKNKNTKDGSLAKELEAAQEQLAELKEKYISLRLSCEELESQHQQEAEDWKQELARLQQLHRQELEHSQLDFRDRTLKLEEELHKQRDRALAVLAEKDLELEQLRSVALSSGLPGRRSPVGGVGGGGLGDPADTASSDSLTQALQLAAANEPTFFLYAEQLARKEVEITSLRKQKHRLEMEAHQLQEKLLEEGERHREEVGALQSHIEKNIRDQSREGANLEYLKNIIYRFLTLPDSLGRQQTLTAILTILHFSPEEKQVIMRLPSGGGWWPSGKR